MKSSSRGFWSLFCRSHVSIDDLLLPHVALPGHDLAGFLDDDIQGILIQQERP
jgi:hypothetical protein